MSTTAPCQPASCAQISGAIAQNSAVVRKYDKWRMHLRNLNVFRQKMLLRARIANQKLDIEPDVVS